MSLRIDDFTYGISGKVEMKNFKKTSKTDSMTRYIVRILIDTPGKKQAWKYIKSSFPMLELEKDKRYAHKFISHKNALKASEEFMDKFIVQIEKTGKYDS